MDLTYPRCCGLDVHKASVFACRRIAREGGKVETIVRTFSTMTPGLLSLLDWLHESEVTHVAMESTGEFWKPVWNILSGHFELVLCNAEHVKKVPGRKTDVKDCEWIAQLLQHGLLRSSFVPTEDVRELRDLTRHRVKLISQHTMTGNRIHKVLEQANIKLGVVASDVLGVSGQRMLEALVRGETDPKVLADLAVGRLRSKIPQLQPALQGRLTEHHRFMLEFLLEQLRSTEAFIAKLDAKIEEKMGPFEKVIERLSTAPGIYRRAAQNVIAEVGADVKSFASAAQLSSWAGICPGNNASAGKQKSGRTPKANRWLKRTLGEIAWAAARTKNTYASAQFRRLAARRGKKRAIVAVGHTMLIAIWHMLKNECDYKDLGPHHFDRLNPERQMRYHVKRLKSLGYTVDVQRVA